MFRLASLLFVALIAQEQDNPAPAPAPKDAAPPKSAPAKPQSMPKAPASKPDAKPDPKNDGKLDPKTGKPATKPVDPKDGDAPPAPLTKEQLEARSLTGKALELFQAQKYQAAIEVAQSALQLDPKYDLATRVLGWSAVATGDDKKAAELLTDALNAAPDNSELQLLLATCHKRLKEWGAALDLLADLVKKHGATAELYQEIAECCIGEEEWKAAEEALLKARELKPKVVALTELLVEVYEKSDQADKAVAELRELLKAQPSQQEYHVHLAQILLDQSKYKEAAEVLENAATVLAEAPIPHQILEQLYAGPYPDPDRLEIHRRWLKEWNQRRR